MNSPHQAGSLTCAHVDMTPQLEMAHGLAGVKLLGVGSHAATRRLLDAHAPEREGDDGDVDATRVPTDRPLRPLEHALLTDGAISLVALRPGTSPRPVHTHQMTGSPRTHSTTLPHLPCPVS